MLLYNIEYLDGGTDESEIGFLDMIEYYTKRFLSEHDGEAYAPQIKRMFVTGRDGSEVANYDWAIEIYQTALDDAAEASRSYEESYTMNRE
jgi:hypothetical protein